MSKDYHIMIRVLLVLINIAECIGFMIFIYILSAYLSCVFGSGSMKVSTEYGDYSIGDTTIINTGGNDE